MITPPAGTRIFIATQPADFRKGIDGLAALVQERLGRHPFSGEMFIFRPRRGDRVKILLWDGTGVCLYQKRLERGRFRWPAAEQREVAVTPAQLAMLLEGLDWRRVTDRRVPAPQYAV